MVSPGVRGPDVVVVLVEVVEVVVVVVVAVELLHDDFAQAHARPRYDSAARSNGGGKILMDSRRRGSDTLRANSNPVRSARSIDPARSASAATQKLGPRLHRGGNGAVGNVFDLAVPTY